MPVSDTEKAITRSLLRSVSALVPRISRRRADLERYRALRRELERIREQVLEHLLQALGVGLDRGRQVGGGFDGELESLLLGDVVEHAFDHAVQLGEPHLTDVHHHGARLDLRQIEDVVDQVEQVVARGVDGLCEFGLPSAQVSIRVLGELVGEDQQAVEGRAELV